MCVSMASIRHNQPISIIEEAVANLKEATELYLEEFPIPNVGRPLVTTFKATCAA